MRKVRPGSACRVGLLVGMALFLGWHVAGQEISGKGEALTFSLSCAGGDCPILKGAPQTSGMRGGVVRLKPGESVGWHSTGQNEEALTILQGSGVANVQGHADVPFGARMLVYIPPNTQHNVTNTGKEALEYVWVVAPVGGKQLRTGAAEKPFWLMAGDARESILSCLRDLSARGSRRIWR